MDLTLDLTMGKYYPYRKPNNEPLYIHRSSNHPLPILNNLPSSIRRRLTETSSDEDIFNNAAPMYNDALQASGYTERLVYDSNRKTQPTAQHRARKRSRRITWFNPLSIRTY